MRNNLPRFLLIVSILATLYGGYMILQRVLPHTLKIEKKYKNPYPIGIRIQSLNINLPVYSTFMDGTKWKIRDDGVSYLATSPIPGKKGNSVMYGHDWPSLLGSLSRIGVNQRIDIVYGDGSVKHFKIIMTQVVTPDQVHIVSNTDDTRLTLYTCTGFLDSRRFVVTAIPDINS